MVLFFLFAVFILTSDFKKNKKEGAMYFSAIGQDSHRFEPDDSKKPCILGGILIPGVPGLQGNSDADVVFHAVCNAVSGLTAVNILGAFTDKLCKEQGITDSRVYVTEALATLGDIRLVHLSMTIEARRPHLAGYMEAMRKSVADCVKLTPEHVGITATSGEGLTAFGRGEGIQVFVVASAWRSAAV
jgi:2-C-methyl-D-erythritol 2,4-cyclodiphosphate synthase